MMLAVFAAGCTMMSPPPAERILGSWRSEIGGYPLEVSYSSETVTVAGNDPVAYTLSGNELRFPEGGSQVRIVSFSGRDRMVLTDPLTGAEHIFERID